MKFRDTLKTFGGVISGLFLSSCISVMVEPSIQPGEIAQATLKILAPGSGALSLTEDVDSSAIEIRYSASGLTETVKCRVLNMSGLIVTSPCVCEEPGSCQLSVRGELNYNGPASLEYRLFAKEEASVEASLVFEIASVNDAPVIGDQSFSIASLGGEAFELVIDDPDNSSWVVTLEEGPKFGVLEGGGPFFTYRPRLPYFSSDHIRVRVSDGLVSSGVAEIDLTIAAEAVAPLDPVAGDYLELPLPTGTGLSIDLPLTNSTNPPVNLANASRSPSVQGSPQLQTTIKRLGKTHSGLTPGAANGQTSGRWHFGAPQIWNSMHEASFAMQAWVYLPTASLLTAQTWHTNIIYGGGGPDSFAPRFGVKRIGGIPRLVMQKHNADLASTTAFPLDQWVHVAVIHDRPTTSTQMFMNGLPVGESSVLSFEHIGHSFQYNLGAAEFNWIWAQPWRGYISNFRFYSRQ